MEVDCKGDKQDLGEINNPMHSVILRAYDSKDRKLHIVKIIEWEALISQNGIQPHMLLRHTWALQHSSWGSSPVGEETERG